MPSLDKFVKAMVWAAESDQVGYSQSDRWGVVFYGSGKYNADCSSLVIQALRYAGFDAGSATYTGNMSAELCARGWKRVAASGTPKVGDILLNDVNHVAVYVGNGMLAQASIDENGDIAGGRAGDQTGEEVNVRGMYSYPWNCYLRWTGSSDATAASTSSISSKSTTVKKPPSPQYRVYREGKWRTWKKDGQTAGVRDVDIYDMEFRGLGPKGWFQLTLEGGKVLARNKRNDAHKKKVIGVTVYFDTDTTKYHPYYEAVYRVWTSEGEWLGWEHDDEDDGAGDDEHALRRIQLKLAQC